MSTFFVGQKVRASYLELQSVSNVDTTSRTTTSTSYTSTLSPANICGVSFTAPPSGKVMLHWESDISNSGATFTLVSPAVKTGSTVGSGTSFLAASDDTSTRSDGTSVQRASSHYLVTGLTAGTVYNVSLEHRVGSGTGTFARRDVTVIPQLA